jgi:L-lactate utilization protein LutC
MTTQMDAKIILSGRVEEPQFQIKQKAWESLPDSSVVEETSVALRANGFKVDVVANRKEALEKVLSLIPDGSSVMTGSSTTLEQIGFVSLLKSGAHPWLNLKDRIFAEKDPQKQAELKKQSTLADYFVGSAQAITQTGQIVSGSGTGSQIAAYAYGAKNLILVVGTPKIVANLDEALRRLREHCVPQEDKRMKSLGMPGTVLSKIFIYEKEPHPNAHVWLILVNEQLGF